MFRLKKYCFDYYIRPIFVVVPPFCFPIPRSFQSCLKISRRNLVIGGENVTTRIVDSLLSALSSTVTVYSLQYCSILSCTTLINSVSIVMVHLSLVLPSLSSLASFSSIIHSLTSVLALARSSVALLALRRFSLSLVSQYRSLFSHFISPCLCVPSDPTSPLSRSLFELPCRFYV